MISCDKKNSISFLFCSFGVSLVIYSCRAGICPQILSESWAEFKESRVSVVCINKLEVNRNFSFSLVQ